MEQIYKERKIGIVKFILSLPEGQKLVGACLMLFIAQWGIIVWQELRHDRDEAKIERITSEANKTLLDFLIKDAQNKRMVKETTDSIASDVKDIKLTTEKHIETMKKLRQ